MRAPSLLCLCAFLALATPASAEEFLTPDQRDFSQVLPPPPADNSLAGMADLDTLLHLQRERTPAQIARAHRVSGQNTFTFAQPVMGDWFTAKNLPRTAAIFAEINHEDDSLVQAAKKVARRPRPYQRDPRVQPIVSRPGINESYPSGHTTGATIWGTILAAAFPAEREGFEAQIQETMWCRQIGGVHFPTDTEAGFIFGKAIAARMLASPRMAAALEEIRVEAAPFRAAQAGAAASPASVGSILSDPSAKPGL